MPRPWKGLAKAKAIRADYVIDIPDDAYTSSGYFVRRYGEKEYTAAKRFVEEVFRCTGI